MPAAAGIRLQPALRNAGEAHLMFGIASLIAAYSPSPAILIGARALLAVGAAMMMPATLSIIRLTFSHEQERGLAIGMERWLRAGAAGAPRRRCCSAVLLVGLRLPDQHSVVIVALVAAVAFIPRREGSSEVAVLSQRLQLVLGYSPLEVALFVLPGSLLAFIGGPLAGRVSPA
jgi:MFS family permease